MSVSHVFQALTLLLCLVSCARRRQPAPGPRFLCHACPKDDESLEYLSIYEIRTSFYLDCARDLPFYSWARYTWEKKIGEHHQYEVLTNTSLIQVFNTTIRFLNFTSSQEGTYLCAANTNEHYQPLQYFSVFNSRIEPSRNNFVDDFHVSPEFSYLKMGCSFYGEVVGDDITYTWVRLINNVYYDLDDNNTRVYPDLQGNLHFLPVSLLDEAPNVTSKAYVCFVTSQKLKLGRYGRNQYITVTAGNTISAAPILINATAYKYGVINKTATLECVFYGFDPNSPTINRWYLPNGTLVPTGTTEKYELSYSGRRLTIKSLQNSDQGLYHCEAENGLGISNKEPNYLRICPDSWNRIFP